MSTGGGEEGKEECVCVCVRESERELPLKTNGSLSLHACALSPAAGGRTPPGANIARLTSEPSALRVSSSIEDRREDRRDHELGRIGKTSASASSKGTCGGFRDEILCACEYV
jgi:hypothetical protein